MKRIGIVLLATNAYFILGIRFIKRFLHFYKGDAKITFYFFSDTDPIPYLPNGVNINYYHTTHSRWTEGTNSKFLNIISIERDLREEEDYVFYFDTDTNMRRNFTEDWFLGDLVGGEHFNNRTPAKKPYDRNPRSKSYVPEETPLPQMYYYGAFFGGNVEEVLKFCKTLYFNQLEDKKINYEPAVNDESYINQYFHYHPPKKVVLNPDFQFVVSDKGGIGETRKTDLDIEQHKMMMYKLKDELYDIQHGKIITNE